jgi:pilus assembly protein CpaF
LDPGSLLIESVFGFFSKCPEFDEVFFNGLDVAAFASGRGTKLSLADALPPLGSFFSSGLQAMDWLQDLAAACNTRLDPMAPSAGGRIPGRPARWHAIFPPLVRNGPVLCVRRSRLDALTLDDFAMDLEIRDSLRTHLAGGGSLLASGPTGSGKSSFIAAILRDLLPAKRMIIIESVEELSGLSPAFVDLVARPPNLAGAGEVGVGWLFQESLRLRPDGIVIGEIRGPEASAFCGALSSGHPWCLATIHAGTPMEALRRLETLAGKRHSSSLPGANVVIVQLNRGCPDGSGASVVGYESVSGLQYS